MDKIICDEIIDIKETNFNVKNITCKTQSFYIILTFLLITITLLIAVSIYCYLIKYRAKQKHLSPFHKKPKNTKSRTYNFFNDIIDIENFDPNNIKIDEKSIFIKFTLFINYIGHVTIKEYVKSYRVNPLYFIFRYVNGYFEEINRYKYLTLVPTNESKEKIKKI